MKHKLRRIFALTMALALMLSFAVTAQAGGGPEYLVRDDVQEDVIQREPDTPDDSTAENAPSVQMPTTSTTQKEDPAPLTPEGNMTLVDDVESETEEEQAVHHGCHQRRQLLLHHHRPGCRRRKYSPFFESGGRRRSFGIDGNGRKGRNAHRLFLHRKVCHWQHQNGL